MYMYYINIEDFKFLGERYIFIFGIVFCGKWIFNVNI